MLSTRTGFPRWKRIRKARLDLFGQLVLRGGPLRITQATNRFRSRIREFDNVHLDFRTLIRTKRWKTLLALRRRLSYSNSFHAPLPKSGTVVDASASTWKDRRARFNSARHTARRTPSHPTPAAPVSALLAGAASSILSKWSRGTSRPQLQFHHSRSLLPRLFLGGRHRWPYGRFQGWDDLVAREGRDGGSHYSDRISLRKISAFTTTLFTLLESARALSTVPRLPISTPATPPS